MNLDLLNNVLSNAKENKFIQNFIKELANHLEKTSNQISNKNDNSINSLKQEDCLYQVIEMDVDGAYLQNTNNNSVSKETDISKEVLDKIGEDSVLRYRDGEYIYEDEITQKFFDNLVDIKEYKEIQDNFMKESNILEIDSNTKYKIESREDNYSMLSYERDGKNTIEVPNQLIPFWAKEGENLYYKDGKFNR